MIKAINTKYKNYYFRSRTEARWAIFFDEMRVKWDYEIEGYELKSGRYLPDFLLHMDGFMGPVKAWVEVKGEYPTVNEIEKLQELGAETAITTYFFIGVPGNHEIYECMTGYFFDKCMRKIDISDKEVEKILCFKKRPATALRNLGPDFMAVANAIDVACSARFEFGESYE